MINRTERVLIGGGILVVVGLIGLTAYLGLQQIANARAEEAAVATRVAALAPTWTAAAQPRATSTPPAATAQPAGVTPTSVPATVVTPRLASPTAPATPVPATPVPATKPVAGATPTEEGRYLGRDPLPPGIDLSNGPFLKEQKARGAKGVSVGDGSLGDELRVAYLDALKAEEEALNTVDASRLRQHFTGDALEELLRGVSTIRDNSGQYRSVVQYEARVMEFIPETSTAGTYELVDARTETVSTAERLPDGKPGKIVKQGEPARVCYSVTLLKEDGRWKVDFVGARQDGPKGHKCPPYWS